MQIWNRLFKQKSVDVESSDGPSRTAVAVAAAAGGSRHGACILLARSGS